MSLIKQIAIRLQFLCFFPSHMANEAVAIEIAVIALFAALSAHDAVRLTSRWSRDWMEEQGSAVSDDGRDGIEGSIGD
jgi:hypothetical protein